MLSHSELVRDCFVRCLRVIERIVQCHVTFSTQDFPEEDVSSLARSFGLGSLALDWLGSGKGALQAEGLARHLSRLCLLALHLELVRLGKVVINCALEGLAVD
mmetsp:Transcript_23234/g.31032  ORF Transcript_23234/g.31032 Transcript_23234/m.31032 type:complete len:103 (+) Transcript_23234:68-376(+)